MRRRTKPPVGSRPGTLVIDSAAQAPTIRLMTYTNSDLAEHAVAGVDELQALIPAEGVSWIDVHGLGDLHTLETLGKLFSIHPLALEDVVHVPTRPKAEAYEHNLLIITRMIRVSGDCDVDSEQFSILVGSNYVLTLQEWDGDVLEPVRQRLRAGRGIIRSAGAGYLGYAILDTIVDAYYPVIEVVADRLEQMEERVMTDPSPKTLRELNRLKNVLIRIRRSVAPQREAVNSLVRDENDFLNDTTRLYLRDTYDHCVSSSEAVENSREFVNGLMNTYLTVISNRMNEVMKTLTILMSIFVPVTFMAGLYGMNFDSMPELHWKWSYPVLLLAMLMVAGGMLLYFRRLGWIGSRTRETDDG
ncbi:MAG: magnesium/cobalt transporter CorA [Acidobacteria bacterium]|uniref:Magnesium transport protein CorA n=1 Tax=Candidatus Polarisedimenticola svalbardensis TaxID=2886004 RepID=A0A8J6XXX2_9BACT|nr:magnesium/cobalt transporter CorA [Candidatus Polarisedimenticola svalbardensis]